VVGTRKAEGTNAENDEIKMMIDDELVFGFDFNLCSISVFDFNRQPRLSHELYPSLYLCILYPSLYLCILCTICKSTYLYPPCRFSRRFQILLLAWASIGYFYFSHLKIIPFVPYRR
jgi:hypothetical protein